MSVFLTEQLITRYSQIALSDNAITVNKTRLVNESRVKAEVQINQRERMYFVIGRIFRYQIRFSLTRVSLTNLVLLTVIALSDNAIWL